MKNWMAPTVVGVLILIIIAIGTQFLERGTTITVLKLQVAALEKTVGVFQDGFKDIDREHKQVGENKIRIDYLEDLHKDGLR